MDYRAILVQTWKIIWNHKVILVFGFIPVVIPGIFAMLIFGGLALSPLVGLESFASLVNEYQFAWIALILMVVLLSIASTPIGYAGILKGTVRAYDGAETVTFKELWAAGWPFVGRLIGIFLSIGLFLSLITMLPTLVGFLTAGLAFLCFLPFFFLLIPVSFLLQAAMSLGMSAIVDGNLGVLAALQRTWRIFRGYFWSLVMLALLLYVLQSVVGILISSPLTVGPALFAFLGWNDNISLASFLRIIGIIAMIASPLILAILGFVAAYVQSAWMLVYLGLTRSPQAVNEIQPVPVGA